MSQDDGSGGLAEQCRSYDAEAFGLLYERCFRKVYNYVYYRIGNTSEAEDLTAQVFSNALEAIEKFDPDKASFLTWVLKMAHNLVVDHFRAKSKRAEVPMSEDIFELQDPDDPEELVLTEMANGGVRKAISNLSDEQQRVIILKFSLGLSNAQIANILDKTEGAVKSLQHRALESLRKMLEKDFTHEFRI